MRSKRAFYLALILSLGSAAFLERAASAQTSSWFGGDFWGGSQSFGSDQTRVYPVYRQHVHWHWHTHPRHTHIVQLTRKPHHQHVAHSVQSAAANRPAQSAAANRPAQSTAAAPLVRTELSQRLAAMQKMSPGTLGMFLNDTTLRSRDAVMTSAGIFIFKGASSSDHAKKDFISLAYAKALPHRAELAAIQKVSLQHFEVVQIEKPKLGKTFEDPRSSSKSFVAIEPKAVRRIAGIQGF